ncbi:hypothetical protein AHiyo8_03660 [Arthrobacter sp. Hiyo8]|nr:hypothetical protein AHiyo8_03660 [Arthrobacter sp. Hiyo8]
MAGYFELMDAPDGGYRVALVDSEDYLVAMSVTFPDGPPQRRASRISGNRRVSHGQGPQARPR